MVSSRCCCWLWRSTQLRPHGVPPTIGAHAEFLERRIFARARAGARQTQAITIPSSGAVTLSGGLVPLSSAMK